MLCLSLILIVAGNSPLNVSLPEIQESLHTSSSNIQRIVDVYSLVLRACCSPPAIADRYARGGQARSVAAVGRPGVAVGLATVEPEQHRVQRA